MAERVIESANGTTYLYRADLPILSPSDHGKDPEIDEIGWTQERFVEAGYLAVVIHEQGVQWLSVYVSK